MNLDIKIDGLEKLSLFATNQLPFATAKALTKTAQDGQTAVIKALESNFTLRTNWYKPSNKVGIRITPAKKDNLTSEVKTGANFLRLHEAGGIKIPFGKYIAIPTSNVRRTKRDLIPKAQHPKTLARAFILTGRRTGVKMLAIRTGKKGKSAIKIMYLLEPRAKIKQLSVFFEPIRKVITSNFQENFNDALRGAMATAR